jgi:hypothetical protein
LLRWWNASLLALTCVACSTSSSDATIDVTFDACAPIAITASADPLRAAGIRDAFALWSDRGVPLLGVGGGAMIELRFEAAAEAFHGLYDDERGIIFINAKLTDPDALAIVIAHELGHAMGLPHIDGEPSLMNQANTTTGPTAEDEQRVRALWGSCE